MNWSDGWELIRRGVGLTESNTYTSSNPEHIYVILYNKYTGIMRILLQTCRGEDYNAAKIKLSFDNTSSMKTDLLEFARGDISPLQKTFIPVDYAAGAEYFNENSKWFYADFPMMYDPCTCIYRSKLKIISELISSSQITIEGAITGQIYTENSGGHAQIKKPGSYSWKDFVSGVNKFSTVSSSIEKFRKETQDYAAAIDTSRNGAIHTFSQFLANNNFLKNGLKFAPYLNSAVGLLNTFIGGGKQTPAGPQEVKLLPLTANLTAKLNGTITTTSPYHNIIFSNPGSKDANQDPDAYPYYNEVLGVFNLINTPEVWWERRTEKLNDWYNYPCLNSQDVTVDRFKIDTNTFKWVLNPAAGMTIQNMKLALVSEATYVPSYYEGDSAFFKPFMNPDFHEFVGKDGTKFL